MDMAYKTTFLEYLKLNNEQLRVSYGKGDNNIFVTPRSTQGHKKHKLGFIASEKIGKGAASG